jgi:hypothetical protein
MSETKPGKHVIFLGAGASMSSGYPSAVELRKAMASENGFASYVRKHLGPDLLSHKIAFEFRERFEDVLEYFRDGGYGSVDEFCYLARGKNPFEVQRLKALMSFILGIVDPESRFEDSDYYPFVQRLFEPSSDKLRDDLCIITLNYDPYLEFLLHRAVQTRARAAKGKDFKCPTDRSILSGFYPGPSDCEDGWQTGEGFCVLKLHGTIAICRKDLPDSKIVTFDDVFESDPRKRAQQLATKLADPNTPVFFPWELLDEGLSFLPPTDHWRGNLPYNEFRGGGLTKLAENIWDRAQKEVERAAKVSFVGFSAHPFLKPALTRLFGKKTGRLKLCVANPDREKYIRLGRVEPILHDSCSAIRLSALLREICPGCRDFIPQPSEMHYYSVPKFEEFIDKDMHPVPDER